MLFCLQHALHCSQALAHFEAVVPASVAARSCEGLGSTRVSHPLPFSGDPAQAGDKSFVDRKLRTLWKPAYRSLKSLET